MKRTKIKIMVLVGAVVMTTLLLFLLIFNLVMRSQIERKSKTAIEQQLQDSGYLSESEMTGILSALVTGENIDEVVDLLLKSLSQDSLSIVLEEGSSGDLLSLLNSLLSDSDYFPGVGSSSKWTDSSFSSLTTSDERSLYTAETLLILPDKKGSLNLERFLTEKEKQIYDWCKEHTVNELKREKILDKVYYIQGTELDYGTAVAYVDVTGEYEMIRRVNVIFLIAAIVIGLLGGLAGYLMGRKLEQTQLVQKQFFENTSHELKTPLTAIRGYAEGIETGVITDYQKTGRVINAQVEQMNTMVEGILSIAKIESGALPIKKEEVSVADFIQDCLMPLEGVVRNRGLAVELQLGAGTVSADPDQLEHAVTNLLTNAIKYSAGRIRITSSAEELMIWNDLPKDFPLSEKDLAHLFDRFYTGPNGNTGIGLALAKEIIGLHGWKVSAELLGEGLAFRIRWA